jgi:hypothetical protein
LLQYTLVHTFIAANGAAASYNAVPHVPPACLLAAACYLIELLMPAMFYGLLQGDELFNNYGTTKPNEELLLGFGFVLDPNPNDSFLVTISHPPQMTNPPDSDTAGTDAGSDGAGDEEGCDASAVWQRRLAAVAAMGLQLDVPITAADPLPSKLLDVILLTAALPAWALDSALSAAAAAAAGARRAPHVGVGQHTSLFPAVPLAFQLQTLLLLQQQFTAKLQGMLPQQHLELILQQQTSDQQQQQQEGPVHASNPNHARMAGIYVLSQQAVLRRALEAVHQETQRCLHPWAATNSMYPAATAAAASAPAAATAVRQHQCIVGGVKLHEQIQLCECCSVPRVTSSSSSSSGYATFGGIPAGSVLLEVPLTSCITSSSKQGLIQQLMLLAAQAHYHKQQQEQEQGQEGEDAGSGSGQQGSVHCGYFGQQWLREAAGGPVGGFDQLLPWWLVPGNQQVVGVLQGGCAARWDSTCGVCDSHITSSCQHMMHVRQ